MSESTALKWLRIFIGMSAVDKAKTCVVLFFPIFGQTSWGLRPFHPAHSSFMACQIWAHPLFLLYLSPSPYFDFAVYSAAINGNIGHFNISIVD